MTEPGPFERLFSEAARNATPLDVLIELTHRCNHRCRHCCITDFDEPDLLTTEAILGLLDELVEMGTLRLTLSGGEALLRRDCLEIAGHARKLGFAVRLLTNGSLVTEALADALARLCVTVEISFHTTDPGTFDEFTQTPGSFGRTTHGIGLLRERGVEVLFKVPITIHNVGTLAAIHEWARSAGADCIAYPAITPADDGSLAPLAHRAPQEVLLSYYASPDSRCPRVAPMSGGALDAVPLCAAAARFACISPSGDVLPCVDLRIVAGNVRWQSFRDIWERSEVMRRIRALRRADLKWCDTCPKLAYCGRCHAQALSEDGDILGPSSWACGHAEALEEAIRRRDA